MPGERKIVINTEELNVSSQMVNVVVKVNKPVPMFGIPSKNT